MAVVVVVVVGSWQSFDSGAVDPPQGGQVISGLYDVCLSCQSVCIPSLFVSGEG